MEHLLERRDPFRVLGILPLLEKKRTLFDLEVGGSYFVSWGYGYAYACEVMQLSGAGLPKGCIMVSVFPTKSQKRMVCILGRHEIGRTPEEAMLHQAKRLK